MITDTIMIQEMMERTQILIDMTGDLKKLAEEAVVDATKDQLSSEADKKAAEERIK